MEKVTKGQKRSVVFWAGGKGRVGDFHFHFMPLCIIGSILMYAYHYFCNFIF